MEQRLVALENRGRGHKPRKTAGHQKQKKAMVFSPRAFRGSSALLTP